MDMHSIIKDGSPLLSFNALVKSDAPEDVYRALNFSYAKFFKMDILCKWAWVGAETLLRTSSGFVYEGLDKTKIAAVIMTSNGCIDVDKKYRESISEIPSPALFVYTLPNIMLGEIAIRHGLKGEQACLADDCFNAEEIYFWVNDLLQNRGMDACICGWVDATTDKHNVKLCWVTKQSNGVVFTPQSLQQLFVH